MPTPCYLDNRFISPSHKAMREAAPLCFGCPLFDACWESGKGEADNVIAGTLPYDPERNAARAAATKGKTCPQGHATEDYGVMVEAPGPDEGVKFRPACRRCADLLRFIATHRDNPTPPPIPETEARTADTIQRHGTEGGYKAHRRRGEPACQRCLNGRNVARARRELEALEERETA